MTNTETLWQEISTAALLGTQRRPFQPARAGGELGAVLTAQPPAEGERLLLRAAAVTALHRRAGRLPELSDAAFQPACPADEWPRCSVQAGGFLEQILGGAKLNLLPEWIETAAAFRQRAREEHLAALLEQHRALQAVSRSVLLPVLGARGGWLAAQNPDWSAFVSYTDERAWHEGQRKQRVTYLTDLRAKDPARARELLAATWSQESPTERLLFLEALSSGLSLADERFLESALDDRRKEVRQAAADLLARLPGAHLVTRMTERTRRLLNWKSGLLRSTLEVNLPETCDPAMARDGIDPHPQAGSQLGEKAGCLAQMLSFVPPQTWSSAWNKRPIQILETVQKSEWEEALLEGWSKAAARFQEAVWLEALMARQAKRNNLGAVTELFTAMPDPEKDRYMISLLRENPNLSYDQTASVWLSACRFPWSPELTQAVTTVICWTLQKGDLQPWRWEKLLRDIPPYFHPDLLEATCERISTALHKQPSGDPFANGLVSALDFRAAMRRAFLPS